MSGHRSADQVWSGRPNATLVSEACRPDAGRALDIGAGEEPTRSGSPSAAGTSWRSTSRRWRWSGGAGAAAIGGRRRRPAVGDGTNAWYRRLGDLPGGDHASSVSSTANITSVHSRCSPMTRGLPDASGSGRRTSTTNNDPDRRAVHGRHCSEHGSSRFALHAPRASAAFAPPCSHDDVSTRSHLPSHRSVLIVAHHPSDLDTPIRRPPAPSCSTPPRRSPLRSARSSRCSCATPAHESSTTTASRSRSTTPCSSRSASARVG